MLHTSFSADGGCLGTDVVVEIGSAVGEIDEIKRCLRLSSTFSVLTESFQKTWLQTLPRADKVLVSPLASGVGCGGNWLPKVPGSGNADPDVFDTGKACDADLSLLVTEGEAKQTSELYNLRRTPWINFEGVQSERGNLPWQDTWKRFQRIVRWNPSKQARGTTVGGRQSLHSTCGAGGEKLPAPWVLAG